MKNKKIPLVTADTPTIAQMMEHPLWGDVADRMNELGVGMDDQSLESVRALLYEPGTTLVVHDRPGFSIVGAVKVTLKKP